jgi:hypothetical protein
LPRGAVIYAVVKDGEFSIGPVGPIESGVVYPMEIDVINRNLPIDIDVYSEVEVRKLAGRAVCAGYWEASRPPTERKIARRADLNYSPRPSPPSFKRRELNTCSRQYQR